MTVLEAKPRLAKASAWLFASLGTWTISKASKLAINSWNVFIYSSILFSWASYRLFNYWATNWELVNTLIPEIPIARDIFKPFIKASYSVSLFYALKPSFRDSSKTSPWDGFSTILNPALFWLEETSTIISYTSHFSLFTIKVLSSCVNSATKSAA